MAASRSLPQQRSVRIDRNAALLWFHWLTVLLVTASFMLAWLSEDMDDLGARAFWLDVHRLIGFAILGLTSVRLAYRLRFGPVSRGGDLPLPFRLASRAIDSLIYAALLALPLLGWIQSSARARRLEMFDVPIPRLVAHDRDAAEMWRWWHEQMGWALLALILLHVLAALYHHYVRRDDVLHAMLPGVTLRAGGRVGRYRPSSRPLRKGLLLPFTARRDGRARRRSGRP